MLALQIARPNSDVARESGIALAATSQTTEPVKKVVTSTKQPMHQIQDVCQSQHKIHGHQIQLFFHRLAVPISLQ